MGYEDKGDLGKSIVTTPSPDWGGGCKSSRKKVEKQ